MKQAFRDATEKMYLAREGTYGKIGRVIIYGGIVFDAVLTIAIIWWVVK